MSPLKVGGYSIMRLMVIGVIATAVLGTQNVFAADAEAGKAKVAQLCAECHRPADWNGDTQAALQSLIKDVVSGKVPHNKRAIKLTDQEIADISTYWNNGRK